MFLRYIKSFLVVGAMLTATASAQNRVDTSVGVMAEPTSMPAKEEAKPKPFKKNLFFASTAINLYTFLGATETKESQSVDLGDRVVLLQLLGFGYFPTEHLRLHLSVQFAETVSGPFPGDDRLTLAAFIPWAAYTSGRYYSGAGPLLASRSGGTAKQDWGVFTSHGAAFKLGKSGLSLTTALVVPVMFGQRFSIAVSPAIGIGYRL